VLEAVGHWLLEQTRPTDILAVDKNRHMLVFLPEYDVAAARDLAGRLNTLAASLRVSLAPAKEPTTVAITFSMGVALLEKGMREDELLARIETLIRKSTALGGHRLSDAP
jgi:two-component system cell cycle response regulator